MTEQFVITLESEAVERLKLLAAERGQSLEEYARQVVEGTLSGFYALKADIGQGLADVEAGRVRDYDSSRVVERGLSLAALRAALIEGDESGMVEDFDSEAFLADLHASHEVRG